MRPIMPGFGRRDTACTPLSRGPMKACPLETKWTPSTAGFVDFASWCPGVLVTRSVRARPFVSSPGCRDERRAAAPLPHRAWRGHDGSERAGERRSGRTMADAAVRLVKPTQRSQGTFTPGMVREQAVATDEMWAGFVTTEAGMVSGWHHHGEYQTAIYVLSGSMRMEFGPGGEQVLDAGPGDFLYVPPHVVHREGNPSEEPGTAVVVRSGKGEVVTNVEGPDPA